ncbi:MAG: RsmD family RNA methyltransferase [Chloroflexi bacterium]|nr:RsmD family RNA methyltransferase [Chloroflexota bacterium]
MPERAPGTGPGSAGRVIAGSARGTRLVAPGAVTRPLGDRVKQTLFAILEPDLRRGPFLDLFAGSGAAGIEALSRGAPGATFVERDRRAETVIRANLDRTHFDGPLVRVVRAEAIAWLAGGPTFGNGPFSVVLVDPPYDQPGLLLAALERLGGIPEARAAGAGIRDAGTAPAGTAPAGTVLEPDGVVVAKHFWRTDLPARVGLLASGRGRRFGDTALTFYRVAEPTEAGE